MKMPELKNKLAQMILNDENCCNYPRPHEYLLTFRLQGIRYEICKCDSCGKLTYREKDER